MNTAFLNNDATIPMQFAAELTGLQIKLFHEGEQVQVHGLPLAFTNPVALVQGIPAIFAWVKGDPARIASFNIVQADGETQMWGELKVATEEAQDTGDFKYYTPFLQG